MRRSCSRASARMVPRARGTARTRSPRRRRESMTRYGGIDLGGTKIQAVVTDDRHEVLGASRHGTPTTGGPAAVAEEIVTALREAAAEAGVPMRALAAVGVGSPGVVDDEAGTVTSARNLSEWEGAYGLRS